MIGISQFHIDAINFYEKMMPSNKIRTLNRTAELYEHMEKEFNKGKLLSWQFLGKVAGGKSTANIKLVTWFNRELLGKEMKVEYILQDQIKFSRFVQDTKNQSICVAVDEWNPMSETGEGATTEQKMLDNINRVQAQRFIHRGSCSPNVMSDESADLIFDVQEMNKKKQTTSCLLRFKFLYQGMYVDQLIGYVEFNVADILAEKWYDTYLKKKFKKMELLNEHRIADDRKIEETVVKYEVIQELKALAKFDNFTEGFIRAYMKDKIDKSKMTSSIPQRSEISREIHGVLNMYYQRQKKLANIYKLKDELKTKILEGEDTSILKNVIEEMDKAYNQICMAIHNVMSRYEAIIEVGSHKLFK